MITFLNFAPLSFMGGAEKWMLDMAEFVASHEETQLIDVSSSLSGPYGRLVLKRKFTNNSAKHKSYRLDNITSLNFYAFLPFSTEFKKIKQQFIDSRLIYLRFELPEVLICIYFGGLKILNKCIAGLHMSVIYAHPIGVLQHAHNFIYGSPLFGFILNKTKRVHVINRRDQKLLLAKFKLKNLHYLPNGTEINHERKFKQDINKLSIVFVGELSQRKGVDTIIRTARIAPNNFTFNFVGDGPLRSEVVALASEKSNCLYLGYLSSKELVEVYQRADVLFFPSRAEAFGLVMIEALANGLVIVNTREVSLEITDEFEFTSRDRAPSSFIRILTKILKLKQQKKIDRDKIVSFCKNNFSIDVINQEFLKRILG